MKKKFYFLFFVFAITIGILSTKSFAYNLFYSYWPNPNNLTFYVSQSVYNEGYSAYAIYGANGWDSSPLINVAQTSSTSNDGTKTSIYASDGVDIGGYVAYSYKYDINGKHCTAGYSCKVWKGTITINAPEFYRTTPDHRYETMVHEMGHILGLAHEDYIRAIMDSDDWMNTKVPLTDDWNGINALY